MVTKTEEKFCLQYVALIAEVRALFDECIAIKQVHGEVDPDHAIAKLEALRRRNNNVRAQITVARKSAVSMRYEQKGAQA